MAITTHTLDQTYHDIVISFCSIIAMVIKWVARRYFHYLLVPYTKRNEQMELGIGGYISRESSIKWLCDSATLLDFFAEVPEEPLSL